MAAVAQFAGIGFRGQVSGVGCRVSGFGFRVSGVRKPKCWIFIPRVKLHWNDECRMSIDEWWNRFAQTF